eukprot:gene25395-33145_t
MTVCTTGKKIGNLTAPAPDPNAQSEKITLIITLFYTNRMGFIMNVLKQYQETPYVQLIDKIIIIWNNIYMSIPPQLYDLKSLVIIKSEVNSLNNRWVLPIPHVKTSAIVMYDDDMFVRYYEALDCMFKTWKQNPDRMISQYVRAIDTTNISDPKYIYDKLHHFNATYHIGIRLVILSTELLILYNNSLTPEMLQYITYGPGMCDDIIMNMITSVATKKPPLRVMLPPWTIFSFDRCHKSDQGLGSVFGRQDIRSTCTRQLLTYFNDAGNVLIPTRELAYCSPFPMEHDEKQFRDIEIPCVEYDRLIMGVEKNATVVTTTNNNNNIASLDDVVEELNKKSVRIGVVSSEFWSLEVDGRMGGFGKAVIMMVKAFEKSQSTSIGLVFLHASKYSDTDEIYCDDNKFHYLHGVPLITLMKNRTCYRSVLDKLALEMVLTIDVRVPYMRVLQDLPSSVAVVIWVHDPHTPEISDKLRANRIPALNQSSAAPTSVSPRSPAIKHELFFAERVLFAVTTPSFVTLYPSAYNLKSLLHYRTTLLPYAMDAIANSRVPTQLAAANNPHSSPRVIFIGRLDAVKRPWLFAETARALPGVEFILLGQVYNYNDAIGFGFSEETKQPPNLKMMGHLEGDKKEEMLASSWLLVSTAIHEGLPFNYIEALQLGIPIVATHDPEKIASRFGIYVGNHPENSGSTAVPLLVKAIQELIDDNPRRKSLGEAGRQWVNDVHSTEGFIRGINQIRSQIKRKQFAPLKAMKLARSVGICAAFLDEEKDLTEWLEFHQKIGVDYFYLYHLDNHSDPESWRQAANRQSASLQNCYETYKNEVDWLAFIDVDEFIVPKVEDADFFVTLSAYKNESGVVLPWRTFGPVHSNPINRPFTNELTHATPYDQRGGILPRMAGTVKLILNTRHPHADYCNFFNIGNLFPKDNRLIHYVHNCLFLSPTPPVDEHYIPVKDPWSLPEHHEATSDVLQLNHYFVRTCFDFEEKKKKKLQSIIARYGANNIPKWFHERLGYGLGVNSSAVCSTLQGYFNTTDETIVPIMKK